MKLAHQGCGENRGLAVDERLAPLVGFGIVEKQRQPFPVSLRAVSLNLFQLRASTPYWPDGDCAVQVDDLARRRERIQRATYMCMPHANIEIEVVRAIPRLPPTRILVCSVNGNTESVL